MTFINARLLDKVAYGFTGGPTWDTTVVRLRNGAVSRNANRSRPIYRFSAAYDSIDTGLHEQVVDAYNAALGPANSFRFRDWSDYQLIGEPIGTAVSGAQTMQLIKRYPFGAVTVSRPITKTDGQAVLLADGLPLASTTNELTGVVSFTAVGGESITATVDFDVPVFFEEDRLEFSLVNWRAHSTEVTLAEDILA